MTFDKSKVYTALNADELQIGSKVILGDALSELKEAVETENEWAMQHLAIIHGEDMMFRFTGDKYHSGHTLAYLVEPPVEIMNDHTYTEEELRTKKYKCRDVCATWNRENRDCEIYGETHPVPLRCPYFAHHIRNRNDK